MKKATNQTGTANRTLLIVTVVLVVVTGAVWLTILYNRNQSKTPVPVEFQNGNIPPPPVSVPSGQ